MELTAPPLHAGKELRPLTLGREVLLACGIAAFVLYAAMDLVSGLSWPGYSFASQAISELSALGAPTRPLWVALGYVFTLLSLAFAAGVLRSAGANGPLRIAGALLLANALIGLAWPFFPMHLRADPKTYTDVGHIVISALTVPLFLATVGFGAAALGKRFRAYSIATLAVLLVCGALTFIEAPRLGAGLPTPWLGIAERVNVHGYMLWMAVLAVALLRSPNRPPTAAS